MQNATCGAMMRDRRRFGPGRRLSVIVRPADDARRVVLRYRAGEDADSEGLKDERQRGEPTKRRPEMRRVLV